MEKSVSRRPNLQAAGLSLSRHPPAQYRPGPFFHAVKYMEPISEPNHVFISYAHIDNRPLLATEKGWITYFHEALSTLLSQQAGFDARIWRDEQMERNAFFDNEIFDNLFQSLTMVSVVSPRYIKAPYCLEELEKFYKRIPPVGNKSRVFKVVKTKVELEEMPEIFRRINGIDFYEIDSETKKPLEFAVDFGAESRAEFLLKVSDLAYEIAQLLKLIPAQAPEDAVLEIEPVPVSATKETTVYLAETSADFYKERDNIRRDLLDRGYEVLPPSDIVPPRTTEEYKNFVRENMQKCSLAVHLIGKNYGQSTEDGEQSFIHLQSIVAAERDTDSNFYRIVWVPKDVNTAQSRQEQFLKEIWDSTAHGVEVYEKPLEELKTNILDALKRVAKPASETKTAAARASVYVLCDKTDADGAAAVEDHIKSAGFEVWSLADYLAGDPSELIMAQKEFLLNCDAVLIYWNSAPSFWARIALQKLQKIFGDGREEDFLGEAVFVEGHAAAEGMELDADLITDFEGLDVFLDGVRSAFQAKFDRRGRK